MRMMGASLRSARYRTCGSTQVSAATSASGRLEHDLRDRDADDGSGGTPTCPSQSLTNMSKPNIVHRGEFTFRGSCSGADSDVATIQHGHLELGRAPGHGCDHCRRIEPHEYIGDILHERVLAVIPHEPVGDVPPLRAGDDARSLATGAAPPCRAVDG
jgi:hypothetical protein